VLLLGERTVESLAASGSAAVVFGDADTTAPTGLWAHSVTTAVSSAVLARFTGVPLDDAFTAGLLHDIGLLVPADADGSPERPVAGLDAVAAGAELLRQWGLPPATVRAVRLHRADPATVVEPLGRTVLAGHAVALALRPRPDHRPCLTPREALAYLGLDGESPTEIMASIQYELDQVVAVLSREPG
jgi:putative nucleotidyltransferase with HDIG domain